MSEIVSKRLFSGWSEVILTFFLFCFLQGFTQESLSKYRWGAALEYHPEDFRLYATTGFLSGPHISNEIQLGVGVKYSLFQQRLNPCVNYQFSVPLHWKKWSFGPVTRISYSVLRLESGKHGLNQLMEAFGGAFIAFGQTNQVRLSGGLGPAWELRFDDYQQRNNTFFHWNYFFQIAYNHAF